MDKNKCNRAIKYVLLAIITGLLTRYIPDIMISNQNIIIISCLVSISYAILDRIAPTI